MTYHGRVRAWVGRAALMLFAIPWIVVPVWLVVVNSLKPRGEAAELQLSLPQSWAFVENYTAVLEDGHYLRALVNSVLVTAPTVAAVCLLGAAAGWAIGRSRTRWMHAVYYGMVISIMIPPTIISSIELLRAIGLNGTALGYVAVMVASRIGTVVFLTTGFVRGLPPDVEEAAALDGASRLRIFVQIVLPLLAPPILVSGTMVLIVTWGDLFVAQFLLPAGGQGTLPLALYSFASGGGASLSWNLVFAHVVMTALPLLVVFLIGQKRIVGGLVEGAVKG